MATCPACHATPAEDARFCPACGTPLPGATAVPVPAPMPAPAGEPRRERRVVTSLFCDLVGFTSLSEAADPEDLDAMLDAYFRLAREAIERHGGTVEKFIGDAVVGVFGVPVVHEDDPARAVRAALAICGGASTLRTAAGGALLLRVGVNTGEALVHLGARPELGEHVLVGDSINTAARIQGAAPELGVAVGARTWESTRLAFAYEELPAASLKGKAQPVRMYRATAERSTPGSDPSRSHEAPFVGREAELAALLDAYERVRSTGCPVLAVLSGEPGIGKSRLLAELAGAIRSQDPDSTWRQGRCLPYGDGTGFWALGEIVKAHAGIRDGEDADAVRASLASSVSGLADADWVCEALLPLVGMAGAGSMGREEQHAAWGAYLRSMTGQGTAVIAFEDVHWADPGLVAFIDDLVRDGEGRLLVVATTRPASHGAGPVLATQAAGVVECALGPLGEADSTALVIGLLGTAVPPELSSPILARCEGNPLYAEEFVRLLGDRDLLERNDGEHRLKPGATIPLPESIHALLASRLDALEPLERSVLARAAVVGSVFWPGAVAALGSGDREAVDTALAALAQRELVRRLPASTMAGEREYAFWHALARDVAYTTQPRAERLDGHLGVAEWIGGQGAGAHTAGVVAHHLVAALDLATAIGGVAGVEGLRLRARDALGEAAAAMLPIDPGAATALYERALSLAPAGDMVRARLLFGFGEAAGRAARNREAVAALDAALLLFEAEGEAEQAGRVMLSMSWPLLATMDPRLDAFAIRALAIFEPLGPSADLVRALTERAWVALRNPNDDLRGYVDRALEVAASLALPVPTRALALRGQARLMTGDIDGGFADFDLALEEALRAGSWADAAELAGNYLSYVWFHHGPAAAAPGTQRMVTVCEEHGLASMGLYYRGNLASVRAAMGDLEGGRQTIDALVEPVMRSGDRLRLLDTRVTQAEIALARGDVATLRTVEADLRVGADDPRNDEPASARFLAAAVLLGTGDREAARSYLHAAVASDHGTSQYWCYLAPMTRVALELGEVGVAADLVRGVSGRAAIQRHGMLTNAALVAEWRGELQPALADFERAAEAWGAFDTPLEAAAARLGASRCSLGLGQLHDAGVAARDAAEAFRQIGAHAWVAEAEAVKDLIALAAAVTG